MNIRDAQQHDLEQIQKLHDIYILDVTKVSNPNYKKKVQKDGFTISSGNSDLSKRIRNSQIFKICEDDNKIVGYIDINREIYFPENANNIKWKNNKLKQIYFHSNNSISLHHIVVLPNYKGKRIALKLLQDCINDLKKKKKIHLFAIITTNPVRNIASISFHEKMGFKEVCITEPIRLFGLENYGSSLFYKKL